MTKHNRVQDRIPPNASTFATCLSSSAEIRASKELLSPSTDEQHSTDEYLFMAGRPPINQFVDFVSTMTLNGAISHKNKLVTQWKKANHYVRQLEEKEAGFADNPSIKEIPSELFGLSKELLRDVNRHTSLQYLQYELGLVELDRLVVSQRHINLAYVNKIKQVLGVKPTIEAVFRVAFGTDRILPSHRFMKTSPTSYMFVSRSEDFRFLGAEIFKPSIEDRLGAVANRATLGLTVGYGANLLNVLKVGERVAINNGYHRAYAFRDLGLTHVPCIIQSPSRPDELYAVGARHVCEYAAQLFSGTRPPVLKDYFDPRLRIVTRVPRRSRAVTVSFKIEEADIPML